MIWHQACMTSFDTETTGTSVETDRVVTATVVRICGAQVESRSWLLDPEVDIPSEAAAIHGVTSEVARERGTDAAEGIWEIAAELYAAWDRDEPLIVANAPFDLTLVDRELRRRHGCGFEIRGTVIDPMCIDRALDPYRPGKRTLTDLCKTYGVKIEGAHDATADALAAARVAYRLAQKWPEYLSVTADLNDLQAQWRHDWSISFVEYLRKQGKPADDVSGEWPLRAYTEAAS